jgi:hypothetical protein
MTEGRLSFSDCCTPTELGGEFLTAYHLWGQTGILRPRKGASCITPPPLRVWCFAFPSTVLLIMPISCVHASAGYSHMSTFAGTEATERSLTGGGDSGAPGFRRCTSCCIPL